MLFNPSCLSSFKIASGKDILSASRYQCKIDIWNDLWSLFADQNNW